MVSNAQPPANAAHEAPKQAPAPHPVENLQAMMNLVLITSGRYMKTVKQNPSESAKMQFQLKRAVAAGSERFHDSLDELENEIRMAQAVMRRDLAQMRAERKQKEQAAKEKEAEKVRQSSTLPKKEDVDAPPPPPAKSPTPPPIKPEPAASTAPVKVEPVAEKSPSPKPASPPADVAMENADALNAAPESEFDFDAMFGDSVMDTSGDGGHDSGELNLVDGDDLGFTLDDQPDQPDLLRGLEDFAKGDDTENTPGQNNTSTLDIDFNMTDMPDLNNNPPPEQPPASKPEEPPAPPPAAATTTTTTDDLDLATMTTDNIDDLFDLDYENPEATQFDDAFFGFDEN